MERKSARKTKSKNVGKQDLRLAEDRPKEFREQNRRVLDSPQLMMEQERLVREVQINSTVFIELKKQFEIAKIEEIKNIPIINVLDAARPPVRKSYPKRVSIVLTALVLSLVAGPAFAGFVGRGTQRLKSLQLAVRRHLPTAVDVAQEATQEKTT